MNQVPSDARIKVRGRSLWTGRRFLFGVAIAVAVLAIGMTFVMVNLRSKLIARRNRLDQIAYSKGIELRWTDSIPFRWRAFYYRVFKRSPGFVDDYFQDVYHLSTSKEDLNLPPDFFQDLNAYDQIADISWDTPRYSAQIAQLIARQRNLDKLRITTQNLTDNDFECISRFTNLRKLRIDGLESPGLHGNFLRAAVGRTPHLDFLCLEHIHLNPEACQSIGRLKSLEGLSLLDCNLTSELAASSLAGLPLLRELVINDALVDDKLVPAFATLPSLIRLRIKGTALTASGLEQLKHCPQLLFLETGGKRGGAKLLSQLCKCTELGLVDIVWSGRFSVSDIANFKKFPNTGYLYFEDIGDEEANHLRQCEHLTGLDIHSRRMTLAGVGSLMQMADLRHLKLDGQDWGQELVDVLYESPTLETVKILDRLWEWWEFEDLRVRLENE